MKVNLVELTDDGRKKTKNELMNGFIHLANIFLKGDEYFNKLCKSTPAKIFSFYHQNAVLNVQRTKLVVDYMSYNGFDDTEQGAVLTDLDRIHGSNVFSTRIRKGLSGQIRALERELNYVDEYKYAHINWDQTPILRASLPFGNN